MNFDLNSFDRIIIACSGGKDSVASTLRLLELGADPRKIEIWHHLVDGSSDEFFDWACTPSYTRAFCDFLGIPIYFSWRQGGFRHEMLKEQDLSAPVFFETPMGLQSVEPTDRAKPNTRRKFPQQSGNLRTRWCSAALKIEVADKAISNQERLKEGRFLFASGERAEESVQRAKYAEFEPHRKQTKSRDIWHWRPLLTYSTRQVWEILQRWSIQPHPAYHLGFGRCSCMSCIFLGDNDLAVLRQIALDRLEEIARYERDFARPDKGFSGTIARSGETILDRSAKTTPRQFDPQWAEHALNKDWQLPIYEPNWELPIGAVAGNIAGGSP